MLIGALALVGELLRRLDGINATGENLQVRSWLPLLYI